MASLPNEDFGGVSHNLDFPDMTNNFSGGTSPKDAVKSPTGSIKSLPELMDNNRSTSFNHDVEWSIHVVPDFIGFRSCNLYLVL